MGLKYIQLTSKLYSYVVEQRSARKDPLLDALRRETEKLGDISRMQISREQGSLFTLLVSALGVKNAVEIGTFTGYSSTCIARGLSSGGKLLCIDISEEWTSIARKYWKKAGLHKKITLKLGPASEVLKKASRSTQFDFAFIDADKPGYNRYYELLLPLMRRNGIMVFDNMLLGGRVLKNKSKDANVKAIRALNQKLSSDKRVESVLIPLADGLTVCRKK